MPEYLGLLLIFLNLLFTAKATIHNAFQNKIPIQCNFELTRAVTDIDLELDRKVCLFNAPKSSIDNLECGQDSLRVAMCRETFLLFEKVNK